jgi:hypothetical protein
LEAEIERALTPYRDLVTPELLEIMRGELERALTKDPVGQALLKQVRPPPVVDQSGDVATREAEASPARKADRGGKR